MRIYIPTKGRVMTQTTLENLPASLYVQTILVAPSTEVPRLRQRYPHVEVICQLDDKMGIAEKRKWIVDTCPDDKLVMLDDDLRFAVRRDDDPGLFRKAEEADILVAFDELEEILTEAIPHAGFSARGSGIGDAAKRGGWQEGKRMMYVLGYYLPIVRHWAEWSRVSTHEDIDITLQLFEMGFPNSVNHSFVVDQKFGSPGGCSDERTIEIANADCLRLKELHPEYVAVDEKEYKASTPRLETRCAWQKALKDGKAFRADWLKSQAK